MSEKIEKRSKSPQQALAALMRLCSRAEKSSGDALRLMRGWGVAAQEQVKVLGELTRLGFIDDRRYAAAYVREKTRLSGWGVYKIRLHLSGKGVAADIIEEATASIDRRESAGRLAEMLEKKARTVKAADRYELKGKLIRYGAGLGYDYEQVLDAAEEIIKNHLHTK